MRDAPEPDSVVARANAILDRLERGEAADSFPPLLAGLFHPSVQPYLVRWQRRDPAVEIARVPGTVLVVPLTNSSAASGSPSRSWRSRH